MASDPSPAPRTQAPATLARLRFGEISVSARKEDLLDLGSLRALPALPRAAAPRAQRRVAYAVLQPSAARRIAPGRSGAELPGAAVGEGAAGAPSRSGGPPAPHALVVFVPLGAAKEFIAGMADAVDQVPGLPPGFRVICVDRPGAGGTDAAPPAPAPERLGEAFRVERRVRAGEDAPGGRPREPFNAQSWRLFVGARDAAEVLLAEGCASVHVAGACLGHPPALAFAWLCGQVSPGTGGLALRLPLMLVTPWVSAQCDESALFTAHGMSRLAGNRLGDGLRGALTGAIGGLMGSVLSSVASSMPAQLGLEKALRRDMTEDEAAQYDELGFSDFSRGDAMHKVQVHSAFQAAGDDLLFAMDTQWQDAFVRPVIKAHAREVRTEVCAHDFEIPECPPEWRSTAVPSRTGEYVESALGVLRAQGASWVQIWAADKDDMVGPPLAQWQFQEYGLQPTFVTGASHVGLLVGGGPARDAWLYRVLLAQVAGASLEQDLPRCAVGA